MISKHRRVCFVENLFACYWFEIRFYFVVHGILLYFCRLFFVASQTNSLTIFSTAVSILGQLQPFHFRFFKLLGNFGKIVVQHQSLGGVGARK